MTPADKHQLRIARRTLFELSDAGALILGGMSKTEARQVIRAKGTEKDKARERALIEE